MKGPPKEQVQGMGASSSAKRQRDELLEVGASRGRVRRASTKNPRVGKNLGECKNKVPEWSKKNKNYKGGNLVRDTVSREGDLVWMREVKQVIKWAIRLSSKGMGQGISMQALYQRRTVVAEAEPGSIEYGVEVSR